MTEPIPKSSTQQPDNNDNRRKSSHFMPGFESLQQAKHSSDANMARRASMNEQHAKPGFLGQMFHNHFGRNADK